jgi:hypothetical protein
LILTLETEKLEDFDLGEIVRLCQVCQNLVVSRILFWLGLSVSFVRVVIGNQNSNKASLFWF